MGRGGILLLGALAIGWMWVALKTISPDNALKAALPFGILHAVLTVKLFLDCKCGEKKDTSQST